MSGLDFTRGQFDKIVSNFLNGKPSRKEADHGWEDTYEYNLVHIKIQVLTRPQKNYPAGTVVAGIWAVRFDSTTFSIWKKSGVGSKGLVAVLTQLQETLLGMAASFLDLCGDTPVLPNPDPLPPEKTPSNADLKKEAWKKERERMLEERHQAKKKDIWSADPIEDGLQGVPEPDKSSIRKALELESAKDKLIEKLREHKKNWEQKSAWDTLLPPDPSPEDMRAEVLRGLKAAVEEIRDASQLVDGPKAAFLLNLINSLQDQMLDTDDGGDAEDTPYDEGETEDVPDKPNKEAYDPIFDEDVNLTDALIESFKEKKKKRTGPPEKSDADDLDDLLNDLDPDVKAPEDPFDLYD